MRPEEADGSVEWEVIAAASESQKQPGVYFLIRSQSVVYVGSSVIDARSRVVNHEIDHDRAAWIPVADVSRCRLVEHAFIVALDPEENSGGKPSHPGDARSVDLGHYLPKLLPITKTVIRESS